MKYRIIFFLLLGNFLAHSQVDTAKIRLPILKSLRFSQGTSPWAVFFPQKADATNIKLELFFEGKYSNMVLQFNCGAYLEAHKSPNGFTHYGFHGLAFRTILSRKRQEIALIGDWVNDDLTSSYHRRMGLKYKYRELKIWSLKFNFELECFLGAGNIPNHFGVGISVGLKNTVDFLGFLPEKTKNRRLKTNKRIKF